MDVPSYESWAPGDWKNMNMTMIIMESILGRPRDYYMAYLRCRKSGQQPLSG